MYDIILSSESLRFYQDADAPLVRKLNRCFVQLSRNPRRHSNIKRLAGTFAGLLRYRIGDWRMIYRIDESENRVIILSIAHRREVYE
jgi:mRNA interferase RelE/StbE